MSDVTWFVDLIPPGSGGSFLEWLGPAEDTEILSLSITNNSSSDRVFDLYVHAAGDPDPETAVLALVNAGAPANSQLCLCFPRVIPGGYQISAIGGLAVTGLILAIEYRPYVSAGGEPPTVFAASVNVDGDELLISFDKPILGDSGFTLTASGGSVTLGTVTPGTQNRRYALSRVISAGETLTLDYTPGDVQDYGGRMLAAFSDLEVTNNSTGGGILLQDTFTDTNGTDLTAHTMDVGPGWTAGAGALTISTNRATAVSLASFYWADCGQVDYTLTVDLTTSASGTSQLSGIVRVTDANNLWMVDIDTSAGAFQLFQRTAGTYTQRAGASVSLANNTTYALAVTTSGDTISATLDGGSGISYGSASQGNSSTLCGIGNSYTTNQYWDNFEVQ